MRLAIFIENNPQKEALSLIKSDKEKYFRGLINNNSMMNENLSFLSISYAQG